MAKKKKKSWKKIVIIGTIILIIGGLVIANLFKKKDVALEVTTVKARTGKLIETIPGTGRVQPEISINISANVSAKITGIFVKEGDQVKQGDRLVTLERERYQAALEQTESSRKSAEAALSKSESELRRARELFQQGLSSEADLEASEADFQYRSAEVERSAAVLKQAKDDLDKTSIYSPMDGIVSLLTKEPGEMALGAQFQQDIIMIIANLGKMEVVVEVDESDIISVSLRDTSDVAIDAYPDTTFKGIVREIAHTATTRGLGTSEEITNFEVKVTLLNIPERLRPGMSATADIITEVREKALYVPIQCVVLKPPLPEEGEYGSEADTTNTPEEENTSEELNQEESSEKQELIEVVFVVRDGIAHQVAVTTGISSDTKIEILTGIEAGDEVVSGPFRTLTQKLSDGNEVKIEEKKERKTGTGRRESVSNADAELMDEM